MKYEQLQALVDNSAVEKLQNHILADLKTALPFIKTVEPYNGQFGQSGIKRTSGAQHAIYLTAIAAPSSKPQAAGDRLHEVVLTAYVLAVDVAGINRSTAAFAIAEAIAELAHFKRWTGWQGKLAFPDEIKINRISSEALEKVGVCLVAVSWSQKVVIGKDQFENPEGAPDQIVSVEVGTATLNGTVFDEANQDG